MPKRGVSRSPSEPKSIEKKNITWSDSDGSSLSYLELNAQQKVAVCCSVLQCVAVCCSVLQCVAVRCSVWQCVSYLELSEQRKVEREKKVGGGRARGKKTDCVCVCVFVCVCVCV